MRRYRAVELMALISLLVSIGCNPRPPETPVGGAPAPAPAQPTTINIIVSPVGLPGIVAHAGDTLIWQTLNPSDPGFTVSFPNNQTYTCGSNTPLQVSYLSPNSCILSGSGGGAVHLLYEITPNSASALQKGGSRPQKPQAPSGPIVYSVVPCKGCADNSLAGQAKPQATVYPDTGFISCPLNKPLNVGPNQDGNVTWDSSAGTWTVTFQQGKNPCTDGSVFSNSSSSSTCNVDPKKTGNYTYNATLDTPSPGCKGQGTLYTGK